MRRGCLNHGLSPHALSAATWTTHFNDDIDIQGHRHKSHKEQHTPYYSSVVSWDGSALRRRSWWCEKERPITGHICLQRRHVDSPLT